MSQNLQLAMAPVADAIEACKGFFDQEGIPYTTADLLVMARMVMKMEQGQAAAAKRARWERAHDMERGLMTTGRAP